MFPSGKVEAEQKFWQTAELVQGLLPYLDLESTLRLAHTHQKTQSILQGSRVWTNLIKRSSPLHQLDKVEHLVDILKLLEDTESNMLDLLDTICEANPGDSMHSWLRPLLEGSIQICQLCPHFEGKCHFHFLIH